MNRKFANALLFGLTTILVIACMSHRAHASDWTETVTAADGTQHVIDYRTLRPAQSYYPDGTPVPAPTEQAQLAAAEAILWKRMPWYEKLGWGGYAAGSALDIASTQVCIARGGVEGNPIYRGLFGPRPSAPQMLLASAAVGWGITYWAHRHNLNARKMAGAVGVARGVIAASNLARCL